MTLCYGDDVRMWTGEDHDLLDYLRRLQQGEWDRAHRIAQADETRLAFRPPGIAHMVEPAEPAARYR